jgi:opacity protein-like surface antigen
MNKHTIPHHTQSALLERWRPRHPAQTARRGRWLVATCVLALMLVPSAARADAYVNPFVGAIFGGTVGTPLNLALNGRNRGTVGIGLGVMGSGVFGVELDVAFTPNLYTESNQIITGNNLLTVVPALIVGIPIGGQRGAGVRPYATLGAGLVRRDVEFASLVSVGRSDLAVSLGGGVMGFVTDHFGIRADARYFRNVQADDVSLGSLNFSLGTFDFSRASVGVLFRF